MDRFILLADRDQDLLNLMTTALRYFYGKDILTAASGSELLSVLESRGNPEVLISSIDLLIQDPGPLKLLEENHTIYPIIGVTSAPDPSALFEKYPFLSELLERPVSVEALTDLAKSFLQTPIESPSHLPINIQTVLDLNCGNFDLFLRLSGTNYVKIISKDDVFSYLDAQKLKEKGVKDLHILSSDAHVLLKNWERDLRLKAQGSPQEVTTNIVLAIETLESVEKFAKALGWPRDTILNAQKTITAAINVLSSDARLVQVLNKRFENRSSTYSHHVGLQCFLNCVFARELDWTKESGEMKLVMASLLHDLGLDEEIYHDVDLWNEKARDLRNKEPAVVKYRQHPFQAARLVHCLDQLPADVEQILLQHHERPDGKGFPRGLAHPRIGQLPSLFILIEDLVHFMERGETLETSVKDFLTWGSEAYGHGHFKKIFDRMKEKLLTAGF